MTITQVHRSEHQLPRLSDISIGVLISFISVIFVGLRHVFKYPDEDYV
jgi:hypothetical protein